MDIEEFTRDSTRRFLEIADAAEVLAVGFRLFPQRLLLDLRYNEQDPPMVKVVQRAGSAEERLRELASARPAFPTPQHFYFILWPRSIPFLVESGVWERILARCRASGHQTVDRDCALALNILTGLERQEVQQALHGQGYRTLWARAQDEGS
jgi:hypothetical protein